MEKQSVVFIFPLTDTLKKYKDFLSEDESIEIYEVDSLDEAQVFIEGVSPALWLMSDPKKCLKFMSAVFKRFKICNSKMVLLLTNNLPTKIIQKMNQIQINNIILEPIPAKSLDYKIKFLLKSLPLKKVEKEGENTEEEKKKISNEEKILEKTNEKVRIEKGIKGDPLLEPSAQAPLNEEEKKNQNLQNEKPQETIKFHSGKIENLKEDEKNEQKKIKEINLNLSEGHKEDKKTTFSLNEEGNSPLKNKSGKSNLDFFEGNNSPSSIPSTSKMKIGLDIEEGSHSKNHSGSLNLIDPLVEEKVKSKGLSLFEENQELKRSHPSLNLFNDKEDNSQEKKNLSLNFSDDKKSRPTSVKLEVEKEQKNNKSTYQEIVDESSTSGIQFKKGSLKLAEAEEKKRSTELFSLDNEQEVDRSRSSLFDDMKDTDPLNHKSTSLGLEVAENKIKDKLQLAIDNKEEENPSDNGNVPLNKDQPTKISKKKLLIEDEVNANNLDLNLDTEEKKKKNKNHLLEMVDDSDEDPRTGPSKASERAKKAKGKSNLDLLDQSEDELKDSLQVDDTDLSPLSKVDLTSPPMNDEENQLNSNLFDVDANKEENANLDLNLMAELPDEGPQSSPLVDPLSDDKKDNKKQINDNWDLEQDKKDQLNSGLPIKKPVVSELNQDNFQKELDSVYRLDKKENENRENPEAGKESEKELEQIFKGLTNSQKENDVYLSKKVFEPNTKGLENTIQVLSLLSTSGPPTNQLKILEFLADKVVTEAQGQVSFFLATVQSKENFHFQEIFSTPSFQLPERQLTATPNGDFLNPEGTDPNYKKWASLKSPHWSDDTFHAVKQEFIYPFLDGLDYVGCAVAKFNREISPEESVKIEIILESSRCILLDYFHNKGGINLQNKNGDYLRKESGPAKKVIQAIQSIWNKLIDFFN